LKNYFELRRTVEGRHYKVAMELIENNNFGPWRSIEYDR